MERAQSTLTSQHENLQIMGGQLKLTKCYQTSISYHWKNNKAYLIIDQRQNLMIKLKQITHNIPYILPMITRTLVGIDTNPLNNNEDIIISF